MIARRLPPGAARNALDCALWDLAAKKGGRPAWQLTGLTRPKPAVTCYTLSLDAPEKMAEAARQVAELPLLKLKLGADGDAARMRAVRAARPDARLVVDANEGWTATSLEALAAVAHETGVEVVEQPLPADADDHLRKVQLPIPVCADESAAPGVPIAHLRDRYDAVNIKLDKTGGLTAACLAVGEARRLGMEIMVGSMVATSLGMAPAVLLSADARWVDLDSPLLLAHDRPDGLTIRNGILAPPRAPLWG
jgi:L-alanine-DL-glutamate epimerase-like enolase superfamily enzyme